MDSPFGTNPETPPEEVKPPSEEPEATKELTEEEKALAILGRDSVLPEPEPVAPPEPVEPSDAHKTIQAILEEHDGLESNIPVNHVYWDIKRRV